MLISDQHRDWWELGGWWPPRESEDRAIAWILIIGLTVVFWIWVLWTLL